jgi:hypothetical protein
MQRLEAIIDKNGVVRLLGEVHLTESRRAVLTILDEKPDADLERQNVSQLSQKKRLSALFAKMRDVKMFQNVENPTTWQRKLRDEWE